MYLEWDKETLDRNLAYQAVSIESGNISVTFLIDFNILNSFTLQVSHQPWRDGRPSTRGAAQSGP